MQRKRTQGVRALTGVTGLASRQAIIAGARAPQPLAQLRPPHGHPTEDASAQAWQGTGRAAPRLA
jgi:hypothetical protein